MKNLLWDLFCHTGKIEYYIKYKEFDKLERHSSREDL